MVFSINDVTPEMLPTSEEYVPMEPYKSYVFTLGENEFRNETVEQLYGPFDHSRSQPSYSPYNSSGYTPPRSPSLTSPTTATSHPVARNENIALQLRQKQIEDLKRHIAEKEGKVNMYKAVLNERIIQENAKLSIRKIKRQSVPQIPTVPAVPIVPSSTPQSDSSTMPRDKPVTPIIVIDDSDVDMELGSDEEDIMETSNEIETENSGIDSPMDSPINDMEDTTEDELSKGEVEDKELLEQTRLMEKEQRELMKELELMEKSIKSLRVQLLEMKVRMSRKGSNKKPKASAAPTVTPQIGSKRKAENETNIPRKSEKRQLYQQQADIYNYGASFYHQFPTPTALQQPYFPPPPTFLPPPIPPPPPPSTERPITPPPPPPTQPKQVYKQNELPKPRQHITQEVPDVQSMDDSLEVQRVLNHVSELVSLRIFDDKKMRPLEERKCLPRPSRLVTIDQYTMPMQMILLNEKKDVAKWEPPSTTFTLPAGVPVEVNMSNSWYESPFFVMLRRRATSQPSNTIMTPIIDAIIKTILPTDDLSTIQIGEMYFVQLENTLQLVRSYVFQHPQNEFLAALKLELSFYVNGNTKAFKDDFNETAALLPLSVDVEWQKIRAEVSFATQLPLILELLHRISQLDTPFASKESATVSSMTAEVLIRLIRLDRLDQVIMLLLTDFKEDFDSEKIIFDMDSTPGLYLQEQDKYIVWMLVLYYYVSKTLPEGVCNIWMNSLIKDGVPTKSLSLFMIDWTPEINRTKLDKHTLFGVTNILLSMLQHFGKKACNDIRRKPLLVGVIRTLFNFLSYDISYKNTGALLLIREMSGIIGQIPEIQELMIEYEIKAGAVISNLVEYVYQSKRFMSPSNICSLSYHVARIYHETRKSSKRNLLVISNLLLYPLLEYETKEIQLDIMNQIAASQGDESKFGLSDENIILLVDTIRQKYLTAMGLDSLMGDQPQQQQKSNKIEQKQLCKTSFAWINLLLLTVISKSLYRKTSIVRDNLDRYTNVIFEESMKKIRSNDGKLLMFKYKQQLM